MKSTRNNRKQFLKNQKKPLTKRKTLHINFFWQKKKRPELGAEIFVNAKFVTFCVLSAVSALINLIFIAGLTKSPYILGDTRGWYISIPAALFLGCLSLALDMSKALHVIQVNTLNSITRYLAEETWVDKVKKVARKWLAVYILYVVLSIITSVSLSSISIGSGITRNANLRDQVTEYIAEGEMYSGINKEATKVNMQNLIGKATDTSEQEAIDFAKDKINEIWPAIEEYQLERTEFINAGLNINSREPVEWNGKEIVPTTYWEKRNNEVNSKLTSAGYPRQTGPAILQLNRSTLQTAIKNRQLESSKTANTDEATAKLNELTDETSTEARAWLETLNTLQLINPKTNEVVVFDVSEDKPASVLAKTAVTQLKALKVDIENDSGDIGISSKIFMQLGGWITNLSKKGDAEGLEAVLTNSTKASTFGPTEIMMMLMLLFLSLLCELGINQFSPEVAISRKMLGQFRRYYDKSFNVNKFMLELALDLNDYDLITDEDVDNEIEYVRKRLRKRAEVAKLLNEMQDLDRLLEDNKLEEALEKTQEELPAPKEEPIKEESVKEEPKEAPKPIVAVSEYYPVSELEDGYSSKVDDAVNEIDELLKEEINNG